MRNFFNKTELPPVDELLQALVSANGFLHPEWEEHEVLFNSAHMGQSCKTHKEFAHKVNKVCELAVIKLQEVTQLNNQFQLSTDINN